MRSTAPWIKTMGWSLVGGVSGYGLPLLLAFGAMAELGDASVRAHQTLGFTVGVGVEPRALTVYVGAGALLAAALAAWRLRPWAGSPEGGAA